MEKNYFLSMLPLVGGSPYSRGLLLLVGSRGYLRENRAVCIGERRGFLICKTSPICRCLPSLSLYFNIYFAPTAATMFQKIQQFHSGGSNTNSFRLLATLFITKNSIDMRILSTELSQLKRIAIINSISNCVCKGCPYRCYILMNLTPLPIVLSDRKIDKKTLPFSVLSPQGPINKKGYPFSSFENKCSRSLSLIAEEFSFTEKLS